MKAYKRYLEIKNQAGWACKIADEFGWDISDKLVTYDCWKENKEKEFADELERQHKKSLRPLENEYTDWFLQTEENAQWARKRRMEYLEKHNPKSVELKMLKNPKPLRGQITDNMIQHAKEYQIAELVEVKNNKFICPWHDDHNPSAHYYEKDNTCYCHVCQNGGDSIALYKKLYSVDFRTAVKALI